MGQIYGAGTDVGLMLVRFMEQELLWCRFGSDLWCRSCCGADVGQILGAEAAVGHIYWAAAALHMMCVRSMGQELLWG